MPTNYQRRKKRDEEKFARYIKPILDKRSEDESVPHFYIDPIRNKLTPNRLPKNNELVAITPGSPKAENVLVLRGWEVAGTIHLMSNVVIWHAGIEYTYQILMSDDPRYGKFSLVNKVKRDQYPGSGTRTGDGGGRKSTYS